MIVIVGDSIKRLTTSPCSSISDLHWGAKSLMEFIDIISIVNVLVDNIL